MSDLFLLTDDQATWVAEHARRRRGKSPDQYRDTFRPDELGRVFIRNDSGETIPAFGVVTLTGSVFENDRIFCKAEKPSSTVYPVAVNGYYDIDAGGFGYVFAGPIVEVLYDGTTAISPGQGWGCNGFEIAKLPTGKPIAWFGMLSQARADLKTAHAIIEPMREVLIKAPSGGIPGRVGSLLGGATCSIVQIETTNGQISTSSVSIKVFNWATTAACSKGDRYGVAGYQHGRWVVIAEDCKDTGSTLPPKPGGSQVRSVTDAISLTLNRQSIIGSFHEVRYSGAGVGGGFS